MSTIGLVTRSALYAFLIVSGAAVTWTQLNGPFAFPGDLIKPGDQLPELKQKYVLSAERPTLLLVLRTGCAFVERSMPFYRSLFEQQRSGQLNTTLILVTPDSKDTMRIFQDVHNLALPVVPDIEMRSIRVRATPTLVLVSPDRTVQGVWEGWLDTTAEAKVLARLSAVSSAEIVPRR